MVEKELRTTFGDLETNMAKEIQEVEEEYEEEDDDDGLDDVDENNIDENPTDEEEEDREEEDSFSTEDQRSLGHLSGASHNKQRSIT